MVFTYSTIISAIKRHLSIIGKRLYTKEGKNLFSDITLSSAGDSEILKQYINASAQDIEALLKQFVTASSYDASKISMTIANARGDSDFEARTQALGESYITLNSVGEYLAMVHPELSQKYKLDARQSMESLVAYVIYKKPPTASANPLSATSVVS